MSIDTSDPKKLPVTRSSGVTEDKRIILGLEGFQIFYVFGTFAFVAITFDSFPAALILTFLVYSFFNIYVKGKPPHYIEYILLFPLRQKQFSHRCTEKKSPFKSQ